MSRSTHPRNDLVGGLQVFAAMASGTHGRDDSRPPRSLAEHRRPTAVAGRLLDIASLLAASSYQPGRPLPKEATRRSDRYELFWSLSFAVHRSTWNGDTDVFTHRSTARIACVVQIRQRTVITEPPMRS